VKSREVGQFRAAAVDSDVSYIESAFVWPTIEFWKNTENRDKTFSIQPVGVSIETSVKRLVDDELAASNGHRSEDNMAGWYLFELPLTETQTREALQKGELKLVTNWTVDFMDVQRSDAMGFEVQNAKGQRIAFRYPSVPAPAETARFKQQIEDSIESRIKAAVEGPPKRVQAISIKGPIWTRMYWAGGREYNENYCWPKKVRTDKNSDPWKVVKESAPAGMEFHMVEQKGDRSSGCADDGNCTGSGESCGTYFLVSGCYVSADWMKWYRATVARINVPEDSKFVCDIKDSK
jgi:hypothetical protein